MARKMQIPIFPYIAVSGEWGKGFGAHDFKSFIRLQSRDNQVVIWQSGGHLIEGGLDSQGIRLDPRSSAASCNWGAEG